MRFTIIAYIFSTAFFLMCDWLTYRILQKDNKKTNSIKMLHIVTSALSMLMITYFYIANSHITEWHDYIVFQNIMLFITILYGAKTIYTTWHYLSANTVKLVKKLPASRHWTDRMNAGKYPVMTRRKFTSQVGIVLASAPFVSLMMGWSKGRFNFETRTQKLYFPNLPKQFDGLKIVQISDLHLGSFNTNYAELENAIDIINAQNPDIICFTGDLVNNFAQETEGWEKVFGRLKAKTGKYSILGNHDYGHYSKWKNQEEFDANFQGIVDAHERLGFKLLRNSAVTLRKQGETIALAGVENWGLPPFPQYGDLAKAESKIPDNTPFSILMTHDPDHWTAEVLDNGRFDLSLAGHTHGMQFGFSFKGMEWSPAKYKFKHWSGLYENGNKYLYVNRGLGVLGLPARIGMRPEITVIELYNGDTKRNVA